MKIAIVGSGISGLCFWLFLQKLGIVEVHDVTIYEARQATAQTSAGESNAETYNASLIGGSLGIGSNGLAVLRHLAESLYEEVMKCGHILKTCKITNARGWTLANVPMGPDQTSMLMIRREAFWQILKDRVPEDVVNRKKVLELEPGGNANVLLLDSGASAEADLVVGADGVWSVVRRAIFEAPEGKGEYKYSPHYEGLVGVGGFVPSSLLDGLPDGEMNVVFGANGFFGYAFTDASPQSPTEHGDSACWWSTYSLDKCPDDWRNIDKENATKQLKARHSTWKNEAVQKIIDQAVIESVYPTFTTPLLPSWERSGSLVLVGDAAHALQPSSGQGASMALEDCEALALFLDHHLKRDPLKGHIAATKRYCELRMPRVGVVHKKAQETGALKQDMGVAKEMMIYFFIWMINRFHLTASYNSRLLDYDGPAEVQRKIGEEAKT